MLVIPIDHPLLHGSHVPLAKLVYQNMGVFTHLFAQTSLKQESCSLLHRLSDLPSWQGNKGNEQDCGSVTGKWAQPMWDIMLEVCKEQV